MALILTDPGGTYVSCCALCGEQNSADGKRHNHLGIDVVNARIHITGPDLIYYPTLARMRNDFCRSFNLRKQGSEYRFAAGCAGTKRHSKTRNIRAFFGPAGLVPPRSAAVRLMRTIG